MGALDFCDWIYTGRKNYDILGHLLLQSEDVVAGGIDQDSVVTGAENPTPNIKHGDSIYVDNGKIALLKCINLPRDHQIHIVQNTGLWACDGHLISHRPPLGVRS
ncbi:hypothetical protein U1Q18_021209 [Sarracenia purpurea var. burkii]